MMAGLAVVASDGGANKEIITDGTTGLIYHNGNVDELTDRLATLITDLPIRKRLSKNGQETALRRFSSKANSDAVFSLYKEILKKK